MKYVLVNNLRYFIPRILVILIYLFLFYIVFHFPFSHIQIRGNNIYNLLYPFDREADWRFVVLVYIIIISLLGVFLLLIQSLYFNFRGDRSQAIKRNHELIFIGIILRYVYSDPPGGSSTEELYNSLKKKLRNKLATEIFFSVIIRIQDMIDEDFSDKFNLLFEKVGIKKKVNWFLKSRKLSEKIIALKIISCLKIIGYRKIIAKYAESRSYVLRTVALSTLIRLSKTDHLDVLLEHVQFISKMDINVIINEVEKNRKADIDYLSLLKSQIPRVNAIGLLLIRIRNKTGYKEMIRPMFLINDPFLHEVAWETFAFFASTDEDLEFMTEKFETESFNNKKLILKSLSFYNQNEKLNGFMDRVIKNEGVLLKIEALRILFEKNVNRFLSYKGSGDKNITIAYNEIVDLNLS